MKLLLEILCFVCCLGCAHWEKNGYEEAVGLIRTRQAECVLVKEGRIAVVERGRGVSPLLKLHDEHLAEMKGAVIVDKVIGRAAAFIALDGGAAKVYGELMSEDARELLEKNGVSVAFAQMVPRILNRRRDGLCPMEQSVLGQTEPSVALTALRNRVRELMQKNSSNAR